MKNEVKKNGTKRKRSIITTTTASFSNGPALEPVRLGWLNWSDGPMRNVTHQESVFKWRPKTFLVFSRTIHHSRFTVVFHSLHEHEESLNALSYREHTLSWKTSLHSSTSLRCSSCIWVYEGWVDLSLTHTALYDLSVIGSWLNTLFFLYFSHSSFSPLSFTHLSHSSTRFSPLPTLFSDSRTLSHFHSPIFTHRSIFIHTSPTIFPNLPLFSPTRSFPTLSLSRQGTQVRNSLVISGRV